MHADTQLPVSAGIVRLGCHHEKRELPLRLVLAQFCGKFIAVHLRHMDIKNREVEFVPTGDPSQGFGRMACLKVLHTPTLRLFPNNPAVCFVVVHHE